MGLLRRARGADAPEAPARRRIRGSLPTGIRLWARRVELPAHVSWLVGAQRATRWSRTTRYTPVPLTSISYTEHDLQLASLVLRIAHDAAGDGEEALIGQMPFRWLGPRSGHIEIDGDGETERSPAAQLPPGTHLFPAGSRTGYLEPDATLIGGSGEDLWAVLIEYDRTERPHKQIDRLRRYDRWLLDGWRKGPFAAHAIAPAVIFLTSREGQSGGAIAPSLKNRVHATLLAFGVPCPVSDLFGTTGRELLARLSCRTRGLRP